MKQGFRSEFDSMGEILIPNDRLWGAQTQRAIENFPISGIRFSRSFIHAIGLIKKACAYVNRQIGLLDSNVADAILEACTELINGYLDEHIPLDIFQTGSGTSTNMNINEVVANRALLILGDRPGSTVHPNDHVNRGQSSNDVIPSAIHIAAVIHLDKYVIPALVKMLNVSYLKQVEFYSIVKSGRTHLQDATPVLLGQEFSGYAEQVNKSIQRLNCASENLRELALGGTAVGTGINRPSMFPAKVINIINRWTGNRFYEASDHFEANSSRDACVEMSGALKTVAVSLIKIANDIRWLSSGPRNGLGELKLPAVQPGSSIMPGKVNPVIPEALIMTAMQIIGNDLTVSMAAMSGNFELNTAMPLIAHNLLESLLILGNAVDVFTEKCLQGITANADRCKATLEGNLSLATSLAPYIGYDKAAAMAKEAYEKGKTIREVAVSWEELPRDIIEKALDPRRMIHPDASGE